MTKILKQLVHALWAIEKDLHVIASNMEVKEKQDLPARLRAGRVTGKNVNLENNHKNLS